MRDLFRQEQEANGGDPGTAFIAILDELDRRNAASATRIEADTEAFRNMAGWQHLMTELINNLPVKMVEATRSAIGRLKPALEQQVEEKARLGAAVGTEASRIAAEALREARSDYETRKRRLKLLSTVALPPAFVAAITVGFLTPAILARTLPASWSWTCTIFGAQHFAGNPDQPTYCVIQKD
ncbi:hypothetical protein F8A10_16845 [Paracoccus kondratievae]|uniref:hypothetical protein n=1 Tax=Paracoccus kondratievae TaxID=135740 RepID=UPI00126613FE|nr:hypothetical protein [Paracoccus kondratievae]QFQ89071.1 hypothetical protein F8A10_16845 [Paracoccus kondratievae]